MGKYCTLRDDYSSNELNKFCAEGLVKVMPKDFDDFDLDDLRYEHSIGA